MPRVHDRRDLEKIAHQSRRIDAQAARIEELETELASPDPLSDNLAIDGLRLAFENEALRQSIAKLTFGAALRDPVEESPKVSKACE